MRSFKIALTICFLFISPAINAQTSDEIDNSATQSSPPKRLTLPPAYDRQMLRLSEILGSLHYIRELCKANEGQKWRDEMQKMLTDEEPKQEQKSQMIAKFNHGFRGFQETYRECTTSAIEANNRYISEGIKLSSEIPTRYGR